LRSVPDYTILYRFLARLEPDDVARVMHEIIRRMPGRWQSRATVAFNATGLAPSAARCYFIPPRSCWRSRGSAGTVG
jgi:hypothetical protein